MKRLSFLFLSIFVLLSLSLLYFQQDEWHTFGILQAYGSKNYLIGGYNIFDIVFNSRIGSRLIVLILFNLFGANGIAFGITSAAFHILNSILVFIIAKRLTKDKTIAYISSIFFLVNSVADQAFIWFGAMTATLPSMTFLLLSVIYYLKFIDKRKYKFILFSLLLIFVSLLFKESAYILFIIYPMLWVLYTKRKSLGSFIRDNILILLYGVFSSFIFINSVISIPGERVNYLSYSSNGLMILLGHLILYPIEGFIQIFLPISLVFGLSNLFTEKFTNIPTGTIDFDVFYAVNMAQYISVVFLILFLIVSFILYKKFRRRLNGDLFKAILSSVFFLFFSFFPFTVLNKSDAYLDSRYYYPGLLGASIFFGTYTIILLDKIKKISYRRLVLFFIIFFLGYHFLALAADIKNQLKASRERVEIINSIKNAVPKLLQKTVFYVSGDSDGYYGLTELKVPFESGLGQVLMVVYNDPEISELFKEKTLQKTLDQGFLYDTISQGYKEEGGRGFGYFTDRDELEKNIKKYKIDPKSSVFAFFYNSENKILVNITSEFRDQISQNIE